MPLGNPGEIRNNTVDSQNIREDCRVSHIADIERNWISSRMGVKQEDQGIDLTQFLAFPQVQQGVDVGKDKKMIDSLR